MMSKKILHFGAALVVIVTFLFWGEARAGILPEIEEPNITVISPNGDEGWVRGETYNITWLLTQPTTDAIEEIQKANIYLVDDSEIAACTDNGVCCYTCTNWELIASVSASAGKYSWTIPSGRALGSKYKIYIRTVSDSCFEGCISDTSDGYFNIVSSSGDNLPPVITSLGGPTNLNVNQTGTWTIQAYDPDGNYLTYSVDWGETVTTPTITSDEMSETTSQSATFSHSYSNSGNYTITFKVADRQGLSAKSTITVQVGGSVAKCTDSDGGQNYYVKGKVCRGDYCESDACFGSSTVDEKYCNGVAINSYNFTCPNGCKDGACISESDNTYPKIIGIPALPTPTLTGQSYSFGWDATDADNDDLVWSVDWGDGISMTVAACPMPNSQQGQGWTFKTVHTWQKAGTYTVKATVSDCKGGSDSHSFSVKVEDAGTTCTDSDGGKNYYIKGTVEHYRGVLNDYCVDSNTLLEGYCLATADSQGNIHSSIKYACPDGCQDGACVSGVACIEDAKVCPDGTVVGRIGPDCEFAACPSEDEDEEEKPLPPAGYEDEVITNSENYQNPFPDIVVNSLEGKAASELYRRSVIGGFSDGEFKGDRPVNRAEAAKFLLLARGVDAGNLRNNDQFRDVKDGEWYEKFVMKAAERGIINGYSDGTFRPAETVNTAEFLKMLTKTFELPCLKHPYLDVPDSAWYAPFVGIAAPKSWSEYKNGYDLFPNRDSTELEPDRDLTRDEVAVAIYQFLKNR